MIRARVHFHDGQSLAVVIGTGEDVKAPRALASMENAGWVIDDTLTMAYKSWLAGRRQGDIALDSTFETWVDNVSDLELRPTEKQIEQAVTLGNMSREEGDKLLALLGDDQGEVNAPRV